MEHQSFPPVIADGVQQAVESMLGTICAAKPVCQGSGGPIEWSNCVVGIISFSGEITWSFTLALPEGTAVALARKLAGYDIPFDSTDMGDVIGELANIIAGDITARLATKRIEAEMTLPTVVRGCDLQLLLPAGTPSLRKCFSSQQGSFWFQLASTSPDRLVGKRPGM